MPTLSSLAAPQVLIKVGVVIALGFQFSAERLRIIYWSEIWQPSRQQRFYHPISFRHEIFHDSAVIMIAMVSKITGVYIVCSSVCAGADQSKHRRSALLALCEGNPPVTGGFPSQRTSSAENISIWWRQTVTLSYRMTLLRAFKPYTVARPYPVFHI